jgi:hypothetical protein
MKCRRIFLFTLALCSFLASADALPRRVPPLRNIADKVSDLRSDLACANSAPYDDMSDELAKTPASSMPASFDLREQLEEVPDVRKQSQTDSGRRVRCGSC